MRRPERVHLTDPSARYKAIESTVKTATSGLDAAHVGFVFTDVHQGCQYGNRGLRYVADFLQPRGVGTQGTTADRKMNAAARFDCLAWSGRDRSVGRPL
jgi:hypothetical protein